MPLSLKLFSCGRLTITTKVIILYLYQTERHKMQLITRKRKFKTLEAATRFVETLAGDWSNGSTTDGGFLVMYDVLQEEIYPGAVDNKGRKIGYLARVVSYTDGHGARVQKMKDGVEWGASQYPKTFETQAEAVSYAMATLKKRAAAL